MFLLLLHDAARTLRYFLLTSLSQLGVIYIISALDPPPWRGGNQKFAKKCTFLRSRDRDRKVCFFGIVTRGDILMQGRVVVMSGRAGSSQHATPFRPLSSWLHMSPTFPSPPLDPQNTQNANSFSLHQEPAGIDGDIWWGSWPTYLVYSPQVLVRWLASLLSSS